MEDPKRIILDLSSDEEVGWGVPCDGGGGGGGDRDDADWIAECLAELDRKMKESDEAAAAAAAGEVVANKKRRIVNTNCACCMDNNDDNDGDDDECVILDGDPGEHVVLNKDGGGENSDDLFVIGEKGQVACRDYPHPRHLCAKFSFESTPHEWHCEQCHCYVCDSLAPCVQWRSPIPSLGHCHATDEWFWQAQRKYLKERNQVPSVAVVPGVSDTSSPKGLG